MLRPIASRPVWATHTNVRSINLGPAGVLSMNIVGGPWQGHELTLRITPNGSRTIDMVIRRTALPFNNAGRPPAKLVVARRMTKK
jgi:hypothetical protein